MKLLLDDELEPITSEIGFLDHDLEKISDSYEGWLRSRGYGVTVRPVTGDLRSVLESLLPLTVGDASRYLFVRTSSPWTAYFENASTGTDAASAMAFMARRLRCRALKVAAVPDSSKQARGRYGATILEMYGPEDTEFLNYIRTIGVGNDYGKWSFHQWGTPLDFEDISVFKARRVQDRFTPELLKTYLEKLGLRAFDEDFYLPTSGAVVLEKRGQNVLQEVSLEEVRRQGS